MNYSGSSCPNMAMMMEKLLVLIVFGALKELVTVCVCLCHFRLRGSVVAAEAFSIYIIIVVHFIVRNIERSIVFLPLSSTASRRFSSSQRRLHSPVPTSLCPSFIMRPVFTYQGFRSYHNMWLFLKQLCIKWDIHFILLLPNKTILDAGARVYAGGKKNCHTVCGRP